MFNKKLLLTLTIFFSLLLMGCQKNRTVYSDTGFYFDTVITVTLYENGSSEILDECMDLALNYENLLSATIEGSDIWNLNHNAVYINDINENFEKLVKRMKSMYNYSMIIIVVTSRKC